ncbi:hypothetical protein BDQ17DRAFT_1338204 [Cyathus striatus]|nr:hypothetical protein BDQ17DRAFT_1338204 [Cyathus striatus]
MAKSDGIYPNQMLNAVILSLPDNIPIEMFTSAVCARECFWEQCRYVVHLLASQNGLILEILKVVILSLPDNITMETLASSDGIYPNRMLKAVILSLPDNIPIEMLTGTVCAWECFWEQCRYIAHLLTHQDTTYMIKYTKD